MTGGTRTRIVLDPTSPRDIDIAAVAVWDLTCVTGKPFAELSRRLQSDLRRDARTLLEKLASAPGVTTLPADPPAADAA